jgi:hypothetical protein
VKSETAGWDELREGLKVIRQELALLSERVSALEVRMDSGAGDSPLTTHHPPPSTHQSPPLKTKV